MVHILWLFSVPLILVAAYGAGWPISRLLGSWGGRRPALFLQLASGFGVISLLQHGAGLTGLVFRGTLVMEASVLVLLGAYSYHLRRPLRGVGESLFKDAGFPLVLIVVALAVNFLLARTPDTQDDARMYHFAAPETYLLLHRIIAEPFNFVWHMPFGIEMDYMLAWAVGGVDLAKLVNVSMLIVLLGLVASLATELGHTRRGGLWAAVWVGTAGLVMDQCWQGKNDIGLAMYTTGAALGLLAIPNGRTRGWTWAAWMLGNAVGVKFVGGLYAAGFVVGGAWYLRGSWSHRVSRIAAVSLAFPLAGWLGASWLFMGNPFHPFLSGIFHEYSWNPGLQRGLEEQARAISSPGVFWIGDWIAGLWRAFGAHDHGSPMLFALLPFVFIGRRGPKTGLLAICFAVSYLIWLDSHRNARYLFPLIPFIAAMGGEAGMTEGGSNPTRERIRRWAWWTVGGYTIASFLAGSVWFLKTDRWQYILGQIGREELLERKFTTWESMRNRVNRILPADARVLFTGEERRLWFDRRITSFGPVSGEGFGKLAGEAHTPEEMRKRVKQLGWTHVVHNFISAEYRTTLWYGGAEWTARSLRIYREFAEKYLGTLDPATRIDDVGGGFWIYEIGDKPALRGNEVYFLPQTEGLFREVRRERNRGNIPAARQALGRLAPLLGATMPFAVELGWLEFGAGNYRDCIDALAPGIKAGLRTSSNLENYGMALVNERRLDEGIGALCEAYLLTGNRSILRSLGVAYFLRAHKLFKGGDIRRAGRDAEQAAFLLPDEPSARDLARRGRQEIMDIAP